MEDYLEDESLITKFDIHTENAYALEKELKEHSKEQAKLHRIYGLSIKEVNKLTLDVNVLIADLVAEYIEEYERDGKKFPMSSRREVRRSVIPLSKRYQKLQTKLNNALANKEFLQGLTWSMSSRSHRLTELVTVMNRTFRDSLQVTHKDLEQNVEDASKLLI